MKASDARSAVLTAIIAAGQATRAELADPAGLGLVCGIDLGASNCRFLVADLLGNPVKVSHDQTPISIGAEALADWLAGRIAALADGSGARLRAVVVGLPGMVAADGTTVTGAPNVPQILGDGFARRLTQAIP